MDSNSQAVGWKHLNLLKISKVTLHYNKETEAATADVE